MTNGCLRALSRQKQSLRQPEDLATRYSHPQTLVELLQQSVGEEQIEAFLRADNEIAATCLQVNTLLSDAQEAEQALTQLGIAFEKHPWLDGCYLVRGTGNLAQLELFPPARSMCRTRRQGLRRWLQAQSRGCGCSTAAPRRAERALPQQLRCRTKEASPRVTFMRTRFL